MIEILIADDHRLVSRGVELIIENQPGMKVAGIVRDGQSAYHMTGELHPDIVLLDISMPPGESGIVTAGKLHSDYPDTRIIMLTMHADKEYLLYTMQVGASGYLLKSSSEEELIEAIRSVHEGGVYVCKEMVPYLVQGFVNRHKEEKEGYLKLSERETQVLTLIAKGYGNKEIGEMLFISVKTVESYKSKIMNKLDLKSRPELVEYALKKRLIQY
ncbi:MAG: response regulator transcription factor [Eubacterium sp.]|nr:response regulator transcription factor [Eubacterium sp.]